MCAARLILAVPQNKSHTLCRRCGQSLFCIELVLRDLSYERPRQMGLDAGFYVDVRPPMYADTGCGHRTGRRSLHVQKHTCSSCGYPAAKMRKCQFEASPRKRHRPVPSHMSPALYPSIIPSNYFLRTKTLTLSTQSTGPKRPSGDGPRERDGRSISVSSLDASGTASGRAILRALEGRRCQLKLLLLRLRDALRNVEWELVSESASMVHLCRMHVYVGVYISAVSMSVCVYAHVHSGLRVRASTFVFDVRTYVVDASGK